MKTRFFVYSVLMQFALCTTVFANSNDSLALSRSYFYTAKQELENMLKGKTPLSYERAIYLIENAYWDNQIDPNVFTSVLDYHTGIIKDIAASNTAKPKEIKSESFWDDLRKYRNREKGYVDKAKMNWAIFTLMTDTVFAIKQNNINYAIHKDPLKYATQDPLGTIDWSNTQVTHLLEYGNGNCFALASLFKIFSERLNTDADICTAPGHIFIAHKDSRGTRYNIELSNHTFPGTGTLETLTYTTDKAVKNGISMKRLDKRQSVALCLVYLAKGYEYKFKTRGDDFALQCAELALQYDSLNLNAMLLKAEVLETTLLNKGKTVAQLQTDKTFKEYESLVTHLYQLGYREMPFDMKNVLIKGWTRDTTVEIITKEHKPRTFDHVDTGYNRFASLSWGLFDEDIVDKPVERYGRTIFDTKKYRIREFVKEETLYNDYNFDPVVFAWSVDPMAHKMPGWSPYAAFANNPILNIDPNGAFPWSIHVRSFAPFDVFGGGFEGDGAKRGYTTAAGKGEGGTVTSRMQHVFTVDPTARTYNAGNAWSDQSSHPVFGKATAKTHANISGFKSSKDKEGNSVATFSTNMAAKNPLVPSSDIDVHTKFTLTENEKTGVLKIHAVQTGDAFPAAETFIGDTKGNQLFIGVSPANGNPYTSLPMDNDRPMMSADFNVTMDKNGVFTGVQQGDKTYSVSDWNQMNQNQPTTK